MIDFFKKAKNPTETLLLWLLPVLVFFLATRTPTDADMWWHLRAGQEMVLQHRILTTDVFSFTRAGAQWTNAFWLADICMYGLYHLGGFFALTLAAAVLVAATMMVILRHSSSSILLDLGLILIASYGISPFNGVRPQLISFLLLAFLDFELTRYKTQRNFRPWLMIILFIFWANIHGGFIWGILLLAAFICGEIFDRITNPKSFATWKSIGNMSFWSLLAISSTAINPNGFRLWKLPFYTVQVSFININEWGSPDFHRLDLQPMLWLIFLLIVGLGFSRKIPDWGDIIKFIGFAYMAFVSQRSIPIFLVVAIPVVSRYLFMAWKDWFPNGFQLKFIKSQNSNLSPKLANGINVCFIFLLAIGAITRAYWLSNLSLVYAEYPAQAVQWIKENKPEGPMFNSYNWGGYLTWSLAEYPVFIDGRADLYGDEILNNWWEVVNGSDKGFGLLDKWKIKLVFLEPGWPLIQKLPAHGWKLLYNNDQVVIYGR